MPEAEYGEMVSAKEAELLPDSALPSQQDDTPESISSIGNALWSYKNEHKINGVQVDSKDQDLPIDRDDLLNAAFTLVSRPRSMMLWMSPDDAEALAKYDELLQRVYDGAVIIQDEVQQYDTNKGKFMVWIRYNEVHYELHPRFQYLREEINEQKG